METQLILATICQYYKIKLVSTQPAIPEPNITLRPKNEMKVFLKRRTQ